MRRFVFQNLSKPTVITPIPTLPWSKIGRFKIKIFSILSYRFCYAFAADLLQ
jgi:hypothetical protein